MKDLVLTVISWYSQATGMGGGGYEAKFTDKVFVTKSPKSGYELYFKHGKNRIEGCETILEVTHTYPPVDLAPPPR